MEIIKELPDDIVEYIYCNILKYYKIRDGKWVRQIIEDRKKCLENKIIRRKRDEKELENELYESFTGEIWRRSRTFYEVRNEIEIEERKEGIVGNDYMEVEICERLEDGKKKYKYIFNRLKRKVGEKRELNNCILNEYYWDMWHYWY